MWDFSNAVPLYVGANGQVPWHVAVSLTLPCRGRFSVNSLPSAASLWAPFAILSLHHRGWRV